MFLNPVIFLSFLFCLMKKVNDIDDKEILYISMNSI